MSAMNFLLDVNASGVVAWWLNDPGHDVAEVGQAARLVRGIEEIEDLTTILLIGFRKCLSSVWRKW